MLMNTSNYSYDDVWPQTFCQQLSDFHLFYFTRIIGGLGFVLNILSVIVLARMSSIHNKSDMIKFLLTKSLTDAYFSLTQVGSIWFDCIECNYYFSFWYQLMYLVFTIYICDICMFISIVCEFMAIFERYRLITGKWESLGKMLEFRRTMPIILLVAFMLYMYQLFSLYVEPFNTSNSTTLYSLEKTEFGNHASRIFDMTQSIIINFVFVTLIFLLNVLTMRQLKVSLQKKREITQTLLGPHAAMQERISRSEGRITLMLMLSAPLTITGNWMNFVENLLVLVNEKMYNGCIDTVTSSVYLFSFSIDFIFYYSFNVHFKKTFDKLMENPIIWIRNRKPG